MDKISDGSICERGNDLIAFLYGEMDESASQDFEGHLLSCNECESELGDFRQIRSSVVSWRQESLGGAPATSVSVSPIAARTSDLSQPSAIAAIRRFFDLSPLWMKGALAFASIMFCLVSVIALTHLFEKPKPVVAEDQKRYSDKELQAKIDDALKVGLQNRETPKPTPPPSTAANNTQKAPGRAVQQSSERETNPKVRRAPLTKSEREQLAADLRLIVPQDESDLDVWSDGSNQ
jgi:hypothetical protein